MLIRRRNTRIEIEQRTVRVVGLPTTETSPAQPWTAPGEGGESATPMDLAPGGSLPSLPDKAAE